MTILSSKTLVDNALKEIKTISTEEAYDLSSNNQCNLIDIRDVRELENQGRIENSNHIPIGLLISVIIFFELIIVIGGWKYKPDLFDQSNLSIVNDVSNTHSLGMVLYTDYIHIFQISGMILLIAMIGAIVLTFRQREGVKKQSYLKQISRERAEGVEVVEVASNRGVKIDD